VLNIIALVPSVIDVDVVDEIVAEDVSANVCIAVVKVALEADTFVVATGVVVCIVIAGVVAVDNVVGRLVVVEEVRVALLVGIVVALSMVTFIVFSVGDAVLTELKVLVEKPVLVFCDVERIVFCDVGLSCSAVGP